MKGVQRGGDGHNDPDDERRMGSTGMRGSHTEIATQLHEQAEQLQQLAIRQQEIVMNLQQASSRQHEIAGLLGTSGELELGEQSRRLEELILETVGQVLHFEAQILERLEHIVVAEAKALKPRQHEAQ